MFDTQSGFGKIPGEYILENIFQIDIHRSKWINLGILLSMIIVYRIIFFLCIKINEDVTPWVRGYLAKRRMQKKNAILNMTVAPNGLTQSPSLKGYVNKQRAGDMALSRV